MKLYVAGIREEAADIKVLAEALERSGHEIVLPWWEFLGQRQSVMAERDVRAIRVADALVVLFKTAGLPYRGALVEIGVALGLEKCVYVVGDGEPPVVFLHHPLVRRGLPLALSDGF